MPTPPLDPVPEPKDEAEKAARENAMKFTKEFLAAIHAYTYNHRSYLPCGYDCTEFMDKLESVYKFCMERPDWTLDIVKRAMVKCEFPLLEWIAEQSPQFVEKLAKP